MIGGTNEMTDSRNGKKRAMARILALVIAGVMLFSVVLAMVLK